MELVPVLNELNDIGIEIKNRNEKLKALRIRKRDLETTIQNYLDKVDKTAIKYKGVVYSYEAKKRIVRKKESEKKDDAISKLISKGLSTREATELYRLVKDSAKGREEISKKLERIKNKK